MSIRYTPRQLTNDQTDTLISQDANNSTIYRYENNSSGLSHFHLSLIHCRICSRTFRSDRIEKHESACENASKKRPAFNMKKQQFPQLQEVLKKPVFVRREPLSEKYTDTKWHREHVDLINKLRNGRVTDIIEEIDENFSNLSSARENCTKCSHCSKKVAAGKNLKSCKHIVHKTNHTPRSVSRLPKIKPRDSDLPRNKAKENHENNKKIKWTGDETTKDSIYYKNSPSLRELCSNLKRNTQASLSRGKRLYCFMAYQLCKKCDASVPETAIYCMICGSKLEY